MAAKIIALFNQSGGVGKTTLTQNLGYHLGQLGRKVLLVDDDPQSSLTVFMGLEPTELKKTLYDAVAKEEEIEIIHDLFGMSLAPASLTLSTAEIELVGAIMGELRLKQALETVKDDYDYILIDCPPSLGILSIMSLVAATHVLVPVQTEFKALKGTELLLNTIVRVLKVANKKLKIAGFVPTMCDTRTAQGENSLKSIYEQLSKIGTVLPTIPRATDFANASQSRKPLALYNPKHPAVEILQQIAKQLDGIQ
ncbi:ParA family protein [Tolypothrix sp. VBCCA 56010]|uniref:ParA family protein n=1 Tax=Tolypothrix sp. VBCCA 56010 TaxID=3137731 RepID=UPI003D7E0934